MTIRVCEMIPWCTILIPTFNGARYLPAMIPSLLDAIDQQCTVLFIDDASVDETLEIISAVTLPGTRIVRNDRNRGLFATLNIALQQVETEYVSLVFQDNLTEREYFKRLHLLV